MLNRYMTKRSKNWEEYEVKFLKDNYSIKGAMYCAEHLSGRTLESVSIKANRLNLKRDNNSRYCVVLAPEGYKHCPSCEQILPSANFYRKLKNNEYSEDVLYYNCRSCAMDKARRSYRRHKSSSVENYKKHPEKKIFQNLKARAKRQHIPFNIELSDIVLPDVCPVLGIPIILFSSSDNSPSVDKFIPDLGYVKGNINIISKRANRIKDNASIEEVEKLLEWMKTKS
jgi:hypothetical protein